MTRDVDATFVPHGIVLEEARNVADMAASPEHVFAMKAFAARSRDEDDLRTLAKIIGVTTTDAALALCERFFPSEPLPPRSRAMLEDLFAAP